MDNIIYIGERNRAYALVVGLLDRGFDIKIESQGAGAVVGVVSPEDAVPASRCIGEILGDIITGV